MNTRRVGSLTGFLLACIAPLAAHAQLQLGQSYNSVSVLCDNQLDSDQFYGVGAFDIKAGAIGECFSFASGDASMVGGSARVSGLPNDAISLTLQTFFEVTSDGPVPLSWDLGVTDVVSVVDLQDFKVVFQAQNGAGEEPLDLSAGVPYRLAGQISLPKGRTLFFTLGEDGGCPPDLDGSGALDLFDFLEFTNQFNAQNPAADCTADGAFDLFDFLCFVNEFNAGC